ncbi:MAG: radical SAM protein [Candidatus Aureabacteria bacterium]|nr:radical SAM protein [Candidatus Auribacterota bacterium]
MSSSSAPDLSQECALYPLSCGGLPVASLYPNAYFFGMSNLGFHALCRLVGEGSGTTLERFCLESMKGKQVRSLERGFDLGRMRIILATVSYEEDSLNLMHILRRAGIEPDRKKRKSPFILAGGSFVTIAPKVLSRIADALYLGYMGNEEKKELQEIFSDKNLSRQSILKKLESIKGIFIPGEAKEENISFPLNIFEQSLYLARDTEFSRMYLMEIGRGCPFRCRFCTTGHLYPHVSWRRAEDVFEVFDDVESRHPGKVQSIGLVAPVPNRHPDIKRILENFCRKGKAVSLSSIRAAGTDKEFFQLLRACRQRSFTIAPEVPGEDDRERMGKKIADAEIFRCLEDARSAGFRQVKMYFLTGCEGMRSREDVTCLEKFLNKVPDDMRVKLSFNPVVPKPGTSLQKRTMPLSADIKNLMKQIRKSLSRKTNVKLKFGSLKRFYIQYKIANGDEETLFEMFGGLKE